MLANAIAMIIFAGVVMYALFGGADFGSGFWDLTAGSAKQGGGIRRQIDRSIAPVWEANHIWLIFVIVYLFTAFPRPFAAIMTTLFIPLAFAVIGIVLRGLGFAFRNVAETTREARIYGASFAISSVVTPFFLGCIAGAIASGRVPLLVRGNLWTSWTGSLSIFGGVLAVATCTFLAAVFLTYDAARRKQQDMVEKFKRRAMASGFVTGIIALFGAFPLRAEAPRLFHQLNGVGLPIVLGSAFAGILTMYFLNENKFNKARIASVAAVGLVVTGWGVSQFPYVLGTHASIQRTAAGPETLWALLITFGLAAVLVVPAFAYLYTLTNKSILDKG